VFARDAGDHRRAAVPWGELALQLDQHGLGEAGADAAGEGQPARGVVYGQDERAERPGPPATAGFVADDDDFLAVTSRSLRLSPTTWPLST
jgi:hypothetical protein